MNLRWLALTVAGLLLALSGPVRAADPPKADAPKADSLPAPKPIVIPGEGQLRVDRNAVWQCYQVDRWGRFRPLVIQPPCGPAYYYANGMVFPWAESYPQEFMRVKISQ
jgi:hypothetical protein